MRKPSDESAAAQVVAFMAAGLVFCGVMAAVILAGHGSAPDPSPTDDESRELDAEAVAGTLVGSTGTGWTDPDLLSELGLVATGVNGLDAAHLGLLQGGGIAAADNGLVDHDEAVLALGLDPAEVNLRMKVDAQALDLIAQGDTYPAYETALIADWNSLPGITVNLGLASDMTASARASINGFQSSNAAADRSLLVQLGLGYDDQVHVGLNAPSVSIALPGPDPQLLPYIGLTLLEGDVFPDQKQYLNDVLGTRLAEYDILVIGTGVDHNALTSTSTKDAIAQWVAQGGILLVMGSSDASSNWLQPLFHVSLASDTGLHAPDPNAAMLNQPNELDWQAYPHDGLGWDLGDSSGLFDHVLSGNVGDVMAVGRPGSFGGEVLLTTVNLRSLTTALGQAESVRFLSNVLVHYGGEVATELHVDIGPEIPDDRAVAYAERDSVVYQEGIGYVPVRIQVWLWEV